MIIIAAMKYVLSILCFSVFVFPLNVRAQTDADEYELMKQAVQYSAEADAYSVYCEKESTLADDFIEKFEEKRNLTPVHKKELHALRDENFNVVREELTEAETDCKDLKFMVKRLELMKKLKDVSYILNGVDPSTLPEPDMPNLEELMPPRSVDPNTLDPTQMQEL